MCNLSADCMLLILHIEIILTNHDPLQPDFIWSNCIRSLITITIIITIPISMTTIWFQPLKPYFTFSILYLRHHHHPSLHNVLIRNTKPYHNYLLYCCRSSSSKLFKSTLIHSLVGSVEWHCRVLQGSAPVLEHIHYWHSICCSTPPLCLNPFELLQINSDWLAGMLNRFVSSSTLRHGKDAGVRPLLTLNSLHFSSSCRADPFRSFADQLWFTLW